MIVDYTHPLFRELLKLKIANIVIPITWVRPMQKVYNSFGSDGYEYISGSPYVSRGAIEVPSHVVSMAERWDGYAGLTLEEFISKATDENDK